MRFRPWCWRPNIQKERGRSGQPVLLLPWIHDIHGAMGILLPHLFKSSTRIRDLYRGICGSGGVVGDHVTPHGEAAHDQKVTSRARNGRAGQFAFLIGNADHNWYTDLDPLLDLAHRVHAGNKGPQSISGSIGCVKGPVTCALVGKVIGSGSSVRYRPMEVMLSEDMRPVGHDHAR